MTTPNKYDIFIESLTKQFSAIPNFHLTQEDGPGKILFNGMVKRIAELNSLKSLYINYYIPTALKATNDDIIEISKSKYESLISLTEQDLKENYYETVRLGYVAAYHKYEIFIKELIARAFFLSLMREMYSLTNTLKKHSVSKYLMFPIRQHYIE
ncbi:MAG: hypothetical protein H7Z76_09175 [Methylotenera sp.]|nr:hypothetical protein [Flavobacterium sp.]